MENSSIISKTKIYPELNLKSSISEAHTRRLEYMRNLRQERRNLFPFISNVLLIHVRMMTRLYSASFYIVAIGRIQVVVIHRVIVDVFADLMTR